MGSVARGGIVAGMVAGVVLLAADRSDACSFVGNSEHPIDEGSADVTPPSEPELLGADLDRNPDGGGCGGSTSCDGVGVLTVSVTATDDVTPPERMGYRLELLEGELPLGLSLEPTPRRLEPNDRILLTWSDKGDALHFRLAVWAVDEAGNLSATSREVEVSDGGFGGCRIGRGRAADALWPVGAVVVLSWISRRRPRRRGDRGSS